MHRTHSYNDKHILDLSKNIMDYINIQTYNECIKNEKSWIFDAFQFNEISNKMPLYSLFMFLFFHEKLNVYLPCIDLFRLMKFVKKVESVYSTNTLPYHNNLHVSSFLHALHIILKHANIPINPLIQFALYLSAITHDYDHRGFTNDYLIRSNHPLSILYNDMSPMENHHLTSIFILLRNDEFNFYKI